MALCFFCRVDSGRVEFLKTDLLLQNTLVVGNKISCRRSVVPGLPNCGTIHNYRGIATPRVTLFVLPNPIQVNSVDKAIGHTVELYTLWFNRRLFGKYLGLVLSPLKQQRQSRSPQPRQNKKRTRGTVCDRTPQYWSQWTDKDPRWAKAGNRPFQVDERQAYGGIWFDLIFQVI